MLHLFFFPVTSFIFNSILFFYWNKCSVSSFHYRPRFTGVISTEGQKALNLPWITNLELWIHRCDLLGKPSDSGFSFLEILGVATVVNVFSMDSKLSFFFFLCNSRNSIVKQKIFKRF